jgi:predicted pyridoxine 5'-phosphate oxidase superfamily flavin-nucleotide-binding protein
LLRSREAQEVEKTGLVVEGMESVKMPSFVKSVYDQEEVAKFLATTSTDGKPNIALIVSQIPVEPHRLVFGEFMMVKTKRNLDENPRVASLAVTPKLEMAGFKAEIVRWVTSGPYVDRINNIDFFRYNAYTGIHNAAVMDVRDILPLPRRVSYGAYVRDFAMVRAAGKCRGDEGVETPGPVKKKLNGIMVVKVLAFQDSDGYPGIVPVFAARTGGRGMVRFKVAAYNKSIERINTPSPVAINVLTMDLLTYQIKGELLGFEKGRGVKTGVVRVDEVYSSIPPLVGERIL